ncbi:hypothetical protein GMA12_09740 [Kocuria sediminis]|uniref:Uncharacterized protein n=1 Tax=Kocuria sediminis TaxID=1038857 RepID=A0A6N8GKI0_9MICC|nr:hypothetical protein [Kocuria sediminis]MUN63418.1 hypothetical protein [Kocuria sediminis]
MTSPIRSESALIRPFIDLHHADVPLENVRLLVGDVEHEAGAIVLPEEELAGARLAVTLPTPAEIRAAVEQTPIPVVDCGLIVLATGRTNRVTYVVEKQYLRVADYDSELLLDRSKADLVFNDRAGFMLTVAVVLLHGLVRKPLQPYMAGTWLARRDFRVSVEQNETSFSPEELTQAIREHHGLPEGSLRYVHVEGVLDEAELSDAVRVYVDTEVLNLLLANPTDTSALQMQIELAIHATEVVASAILRELSESCEPTPEALETYPAALRFFQNLARTLKTDMATILNLADEPSRLRAHLEAAFDARKASIVALKESR